MTDPLSKNKVLFDFTKLTSGLHKEIYDWLEENIDDYYIADSVETFYSIIYFSDPAEAVEFKLLWGNK